MKRLALLTLVVFLVAAFSVQTIQAEPLENRDIEISVGGNFLWLPEESGGLIEVGARMTPQFYLWGGLAPDSFVQVGFDYEIARREMEEETGFLSLALGATMVGDYGGSPIMSVNLRSEEDPAYLFMRGGYNFGQIGAAITF